MKKLFIAITVCIAVLAWILISNRHQPDMNFKQKILKTFYPVLTYFSGKKNLKTHHMQKSPTSFYDLQAIANNASLFDLRKLKGKKVLVVNTASNCGYTAQYEELQKLYETHQDKLTIIAFPANDFKEQEKGTDDEIAQFCKVNYGVSFPIMKKSVVIVGAAQNDVFKWLTSPALNGWNQQAPEWNFSKYLIDENGVLTNYFSPGISPLSKEFLEAVNQ